MILKKRDAMKRSRDGSKMPFYNAASLRSRFASSDHSIIRLVAVVVLVVVMASCTGAPPSSVPTLAVLPSPTLQVPTRMVDTPIAAVVVAADTPTISITLTDTPTDAPTATPSQEPSPTKTTPPPSPTKNPPTAQLSLTPTTTATLTPSQSQPSSPTPGRDIRPIPNQGGGFPTPLISAIPPNTATPTGTPTVTQTASVTPLPTPIGDASITMTQQVVNLMSEPSLTGDIVEAVSSGENVFLIGRSDDGEWYQARLMNGTEGWIYGLYLVIWMDTSRLVVTHFRPTQPPVAMVGSFALGGHVMNVNQEAFGIARQAGMTWIKVQHRYYNGENGSVVAPMIDSVHRAGFRILLGVVGDRGQLASLPNYQAAYANFVAQVAQAGADAIEIWNEPNIDREWPRGFIHGGNYTELLRASYNAIKAVHPSTIVISAAPAPTGFFGPEGCGDGGCNDDIFLTQMAFAGAQNYLDCVGLHHNDGIVSPTQDSGDPRGNHPTYYLRGVISRVPAAFNSRPLCFTELGYLSPEGYGPLPPNFAWAGSTTVTEQAQWLGDAVRVARATGRVQMLIVWNVDFNVYTSDDPMAGYAIRRAGGSCPACDALAAAMR